MIEIQRVRQVILEDLGKTFPAAQVEIRRRGECIYSDSMGYADPEQGRAVTPDTRFDLASVSKLFTVAAFMTCVEEGLAGLDQPVAEVIAEFSGPRPIVPYPDPLQSGAFIQVYDKVGEKAQAESVRFRNLLAHNAGLPAWLSLYGLESRDEMVKHVLATRFAYPPGTRVVYSDIGLILLGLSLERLTGQPLRDAVRERVTAPLGLGGIEYGPLECEKVAATEFYTRQGKRMCGQVHDENALGLGGAAGHAGLFGNAHEVVEFGEKFRQGGGSLLKEETVAEMQREQAREGGVRRGLGFALWSPDPEASSHPLSPESFGHLGFTGTSLWIDPRRELTIACLTNRVYYGRQNAAEIGAFRIKLHESIVEAVDAG